MDRDAHKRAAAEAAAGMVEDGMIVGLGTGSTARFAIDALIRRVREGLRIRAIPTSERSAAQAREGGIPLTGFAEHRRLDLTIDGADEIELGTLNLIKGLGGALLREKIVAAASDRLVIVADEPKAGGAARGAPCRSRSRSCRSAGRRPPTACAVSAPTRSRGATRAGQLFCTDGGNRILDCRFRRDRRSGRPGPGHRSDRRRGGNRAVHRHGQATPWSPSDDGRSADLASG